MSVKNLTKMLQDFEENLKLATEDLSGESGNPAIIGRLTVQSGARQAVELIKDAYYNEVMGHFVKFFLVGDKKVAKRVAEFAYQNDALAFDCEQFYRTIAVEVDKTVMNNRLFTNVQMVKAIQVLAFMAFEELDMSHYPDPVFTEHEMTAQVPTLNDVTKIVKSAIRRTDYDTLNGQYIIKEIFTQALTKRVKFAKIPVVLYGADKDEVESLSDKLFYGRPSVTIEVSENSTNEEIAKKINQELKQIKNS